MTDALTATIARVRERLREYDAARLPGFKREQSGLRLADECVRAIPTILAALASATERAERAEAQRDVNCEQLTRMSDRAKAEGALARKAEAERDAAMARAERAEAEAKANENRARLNWEEGYRQNLRASKAEDDLDAALAKLARVEAVRRSLIAEATDPNAVRAERNMASRVALELELALFAPPTDNAKP